MCDLHRRRSSSLYLIFVFTFVVCIHTTFAATPNASPNAALSPEIQGDLLMVHRSYAAAIEAYERESQPSAKLWNKIGVAYHHMFALEQARKYYQMALAMNPNFPEALNNLAAVYHGQHDYKQAERTYKLALKYSPGAAITYCNLGTAYFADEKYKQGMEAYRKALALNPNIFDAWPDADCPGDDHAPAAGCRQLLPGQNLRHGREDAGSDWLPAQGAGRRIQ